MLIIYSILKTITSINNANYHLNTFLSASAWSSLSNLNISTKALPADLNVLLIVMESSFQVFITKLITSTCTFTFQNLLSYYVEGISCSLAPVKKRVKMSNSWPLSHIAIQTLTSVVNI